MNETQLKVSPYTFVPVRGSWRTQLRSFWEQSNMGKADGLDLLRAETSPYVIIRNCTNPHEMFTTNKPFLKALPFMIAVSLLREH